MRCVQVAVHTHELGSGGAGRFPAVTGFGRRLAVQVTPTGVTARCRDHGPVA